MEAPSLDLARRLVGIDISRPYASQLASGDRKPSLTLALRIYRELGLQLGPLEGAEPDEIAALEKLAQRKAG